MTHCYSRAGWAPTEPVSLTEAMGQCDGTEGCEDSGEETKEIF